MFIHKHVSSPLLFPTYFRAHHQGDKKSEQKGLKVKGAYQLQMTTDDVKLLDKSINTVNRTTEGLLLVGKC
jgi:hypothetical protein